MNHDQWAEQMIQARDTATFAPRPSEWVEGFDLDAGYQVGRAAQESLIARGCRPVGRKIGFTNRAMWPQFGVEAPLWGTMYDRTVFFAEQGVFRLALDGMVAPRIEPEVVLKLKSAVTKDATTAEAVLACVEWAALGFEIVDCHYPDWKFSAGDGVADFGLHAALIVGSPLRMEWNDAAATTRLESVEVTLRRGGETLASGFGRNALGSPLLSVAFLAKILAAQPWAAPLVAGDLLTTGTLTAAFPIQSGERWSASAQGLALSPLTLEL
jgi:2-keto-4-pentenoate hydratase